MQMHKPEKPFGWLTVHDALAWIASRSIPADWDKAFYFRSSHWFEITPTEVIAHLQEMIAEEKGSLFRAVRYGTGFEQAVHRAAMLLTASNNAQTTSAVLDHDAEAKVLIAHLTEHLREATYLHRKIREAAEALRQAVGRGELPAYGWRGDTPDLDDRKPVTQARERIPSEVCQGPVTFTDTGIAPVASRDDASFGYSPLWSSVLFAADDVLKLWTAEQPNEAPLDPTQVTLTPITNAAEAPHKLPTQLAAYNQQNLRAWYLLRVHALPDAARPPTEEEDCSAAVAYFADPIPRSAVRRVRRDLAPPTWRRPGPRRPK